MLPRTKAVGPTAAAIPPISDGRQTAKHKGTPDPL